MREKEKMLRKAAETIDAEPEQLLSTIRKLQKEIEEFEEEISGA